MYIIRYPPLLGVGGTETRTDFVIYILRWLIDVNASVYLSTSWRSKYLPEFKIQIAARKMMISEGRDLRSCSIVLGRNSRVLPYRFPCELCIKPSHAFDDCLSDQGVCVRANLVSISLSKANGKGRAMDEPLCLFLINWRLLAGVREGTGIAHRRYFSTWVTNHPEKHSTNK